MGWSLLHDNMHVVQCKMRELHLPTHLIWSIWTDLSLSPYLSIQMTHLGSYIIITILNTAQAEPSKVTRFVELIASPIVTVR